MGGGGSNHGERLWELSKLKESGRINLLARRMWISLCSRCSTGMLDGSLFKKKRN